MLCGLMVIGCLVAGPVLSHGATPRLDGKSPGRPDAGEVGRPSAPSHPDDLTFEPGPLTLVTDEPTGRRYFVFTYVVTNNTRKDQRFYPRFELFMGDGLLAQAGADVPPEVSARLRRAVAAPQALDQFQIHGDIKFGKANSKDGFVIWPASGDMKDLTLFASGMKATIPKEARLEAADRQPRWTLRLNFRVPGAPSPHVSSEAVRVTMNGLDALWVVR
jgi:hypothetical protein